MGYSIEQLDVEFRIKKENFRPCLKALKEANVELSLNTSDLKTALEECRWTPYIDTDHGDIVYIEFTGDKLMDDEEIFDAIAPYVEAGSFIGIQGEDRSMWKWVFNGKECLEKSAVIDWEDNAEIVQALLNHKEILPTLLNIHPSLDKKIQDTLKD